MELSANRKSKSKKEIEAYDMESRGRSLTRSVSFSGVSNPAPGPTSRSPVKSDSQTSITTPTLQSQGFEAPAATGNTLESQLQAISDLPPFQRIIQKLLSPEVTSMSPGIETPGTEQSKSVFNETLMSSGSPKLSRHPTVIRYPKSSPINSPVGNDLKITAISPISDDASLIGNSADFIVSKDNRNTDPNPLPVVYGFTGSSGPGYDTKPSGNSKGDIEKEMLVDDTPFTPAANYHDSMDPETSSGQKAIALYGRVNKNSLNSSTHRQHSFPASNHGTILGQPQVGVPITRPSLTRVPLVGVPSSGGALSAAVPYTSSPPVKSRTPISSQHNPFRNRALSISPLSSNPLSSGILFPFEHHHGSYPDPVFQEAASLGYVQQVSNLSDESSESQASKPISNSNSRVNSIFHLKYTKSGKNGPRSFRTSDFQNDSDDKNNSKDFVNNETAQVLEEQESTPIGDGIGSRTLIAIIALSVIVILLLGGFIPATVILLQGTRRSVNNFFQKESNRIAVLPGLIEKYGDTTNSFTNRVNYTSNSLNRTLSSQVAFSGLPIQFQSDQEILNLIQDSGKPIFHGIAYSPLNAMEPSCGITKRSTMLDLAKVSTVTKRIRNYGMQCNQSDLILDSIQTLNLDMKLAMGVWIGSNETINRQQIQSMREVLSKYPARLFESIFIGNEVLFRQDRSTNQLVQYITETKAYLETIDHKGIPVGTSELGSLISPELLAGCDIVGANIHPFFGGDIVERATDWVLNFLQYQLEPINTQKVKIVITEVGWPTAGGAFQKSLASLPNLKFFVEDFICKIAKFQYGWYFFEAFDEPWKRIFHEGNNRWETEWGVFTKDRGNKIDWESLSKCRLL